MSRRDWLTFTLGSALLFAGLLGLLALYNAATAVG